MRVRTALQVGSLLLHCSLSSFCSVRLGSNLRNGRVHDTARREAPRAVDTEYYRSKVRGHGTGRKPDDLVVRMERLLVLAGFGALHLHRPPGPWQSTTAWSSGPPPDGENGIFEGQSSIHLCRNPDCRSPGPLHCQSYASVDAEALVDLGAYSGFTGTGGSRRQCFPTLRSAWMPMVSVQSKIQGSVGPGRFPSNPWNPKTTRPGIRVREQALRRSRAWPKHAGSWERTLPSTASLTGRGRSSRSNHPSLHPKSLYRSYGNYLHHGAPTLCGFCFQRKYGVVGRAGTLCHKQGERPQLVSETETAKSTTGGGVGLFMPCGVRPNLSEHHLSQAGSSGRWKVEVGL